MSKRTDNLYNVQVARYAWIAVEADSPEEAMKMADRADLDELIDDWRFEDGDIEVSACYTYSESLESLCLNDNEYIITKDGNMTAGEYRCALEEDE